MCLMACVTFKRAASQRRRREVVERIAWNGWNAGNESGLGLVSYHNGEELPILRSLDFLNFSLRLRRGEVPIGERALIHARLSTNKIDLAHTHPFTDDGASLIHNGVVRLAEGVKPPAVKTTNDSELLLRLYLEGGRLLERALEGTYGLANTMLADVLLGKVYLYPDMGDFLVYEGSKVVETLYCQSEKQIHGLTNARPVDHLEAGTIYGLPLKMGRGRDLEEALVAVKRPDPPPMNYTQFSDLDGMVSLYQWEKLQESETEPRGREYFRFGRL